MAYVRQICLVSGVGFRFAEETSGRRCVRSGHIYTLANTQHREKEGIKAWTGRWMAATDRSFRCKLVATEIVCHLTATGGVLVRVSCWTSNADGSVLLLQIHVKVVSENKDASVPFFQIYGQVVVLLNGCHWHAPTDDGSVDLITSVRNQTQPVKRQEQSCLTRRGGPTRTVNNFNLKVSFKLSIANNLWGQG